MIVRGSCHCCTLFIVWIQQSDCFVFFFGYVVVVAAAAVASVSVAFFMFFRRAFFRLFIRSFAFFAIRMSKYTELVWFSLSNMQKKNALNQHKIPQTETDMLECKHFNMAGSMVACNTITAICECKYDPVHFFSFLSNWNTPFKCIHSFQSCEINLNWKDVKYEQHKQKPISHIWK